MPAKKDLTGQRFGQLVVAAEAGVDKHHDVLWRCKCDCGTEIVIAGRWLREGKKASCGCTKAELRRYNTRSRLHRIWQGVKSRCDNPHTASYRKYGAKGITICNEWKDDYAAFKTWALSNGYADNLTIDRIDSEGNYEPSNCRWVGYNVQNNNRSSVPLLYYDGQAHTAAEWAGIVGVKYNTLKSRLKNGWPLERALSESVHIEKTRRS